MSIHKDDHRTHPYVVRWREPKPGGGYRNRQERFERINGRGGAREWDEDKRREKRRGVVIVPEADRMTLADFWEGVYKPLRVESLAQPYAVLGRWLPIRRGPGVNHVGHRWGHYRLQQIRREEIERWHREMERAGCTAATMFTAHDLLASMLKFAVGHDYLHKSPATGLHPHYDPSFDERPWMPAEVEIVRRQLLTPILYSGMSEWQRQRNATMVSVLAYAGLRPTEAIHLAWERVRQRTLYLTETKTRVDRSVPLTETLLRDLNAWRLRCGRPSKGLVFPHAEGDQKPWSRTDWGNWGKAQWHTALERSGVAYVRPYHLRHSCVSMWIYAGVPLPEVARRAGHSQGECLRTYSHVFEDFDHAERLDIEAAIRDARGESTDVRLGIAQ